MKIDLNPKIVSSWLTSVLHGLHIALDECKIFVFGKFPGKAKSVTTATHTVFRALMKKTITHVFILFVIITDFISAANAVCLDPETLISGYQIPINDEILASEVIVIGEVIRSTYLQKDPSDLNGITTSVYTVQVSSRIKGSLPDVIELKSENDSGKYWMEVGERHLLFLCIEGIYYKVDSCGNSTPLPKGNDVLRRVEVMLAGSAKTP